jgi:predicted amidophosphoribosyltransferase
MIGLNMGGAMANTMGKMMENTFDNINKPDKKADKVICGSCQTPNTKEAKYCSGCGKELGLAVHIVECPNCKSQEDSGGNFCIQCGKPLKIKCSQCSFLSFINSKFCNNCGNEFR